MFAFLLGGVVAILNSFIYAELGAAFPASGGAYAVLLRVFGRPLGLISAFLYLLLGLGSVPSLVLGTANYLHVLFPGLSITLFSIAVLLLATLVAVLRIHSASWVAAAMVIIEFVIIIGVTVVSLLHAVHPLSFALSMYAVTSHGVHGPIGSAVLISMLGVTLFSFSGYELSQNFAEETTDVRRVLAETIMISAVIAVVVEMAAVLALTLAAKHIGGVVVANVPTIQVVQTMLGTTFATVMIVGVIVATFDCTIAVNMSYIRVFYNGARDGMFTRRVSRWLAALSPSSQVPVRIALVWGVLVLILSVFGTLDAAIAFTGVVLVLIYALVSAAALVARKRMPERISFKMPGWPIPPALVLIVLTYVLTQQKPAYLLITLGVIVLSSLYYVLILRKHWSGVDIVEPTDAAPDDAANV